VELRTEGVDDLFFSVQDVADCFYQFRIPVYLRKYFGLRPVRAGDVGITSVDGVDVRPSQQIFPVIAVLPMGFSYAVHWTQAAHRELLARCGAGGLESELVDRQPAPLFSNVSPLKLIYIDNELFVSPVPGESSSSRKHVHNALSKHGLPFHEIEDEKRLITIIGIELDGIKHRARAAQAKRWRLFGTFGMRRSA
jgi:hypothetical protein